MGNLVIGIHLGPARCEAVYLDRQGTVIARGSAPGGGSSLPWGGVPEAQLAGCWQAVQQAVQAARHALGASGPAGQPAALSIAADSDAAVFMSRYGVAIAPPATASADEIRESMAEAWRSPGWGSDPCTCGYAPVLAAQSRWLRQHHPAAHARVQRAGTVRDWLLWRLCGVWATDPASGPGGSLWPAAVGLQTGWHGDALATVLPWEATAGSLLTGAAHDLGLPPGLPVATGTNTGAAALLGSGCVQPGAASLDRASGATLTVVAAAPAPGCIGYPLLPGAWAQVIDLTAPAGALVAGRGPAQHEVAAALAQTPTGRCVVTDDEANTKMLALALGDSLSGTTLTANPDASARGAALLAMVAAGWQQSIGHLVSPPVVHVATPLVGKGKPRQGMRRNPSSAG